jgi:tetratricopeptide (TPR) repeat protein
MDHFVSSRPIRIGIAACTLVLFGFYVYAIYSVWRADWLRDQLDQRSLEASANLQPWNAQTQWLLGRYSLNATQDYANALTFLQHAIQLNPYEGRYWLDLAAARQVRGETKESQEALERGLRAEPTSTEIAWETANFYLVQNDASRALPLLRVAFQHDPRYTGAAIDLSWRATKSVSQVVSQALPAQPAPYFAFLKILTAQNQSSPASELWQDLITRRFSFPVEEAFPYLDYLIRAQQIDQAKKVWTDLTKVHPELQDDPTSNLVRNGGFERELVNGGFDWRSRQNGPMNVSVDTAEFHRGTRALRIEFSGPAGSDMGVYEYVPVQPSTEYRFGAYVKTQDITTASGPRLAVEDSATGKVLATTDEFLETNDWSEHAAEIVTGADTHLVTLRIVRIPGNPLIKGTLWLDDVQLTPKPPALRATP